MYRFNHKNQFQVDRSFSIHKDEINTLDEK
jgi:hypothetical protein